jgi:hypothetical protein
MSRSLEFAPSWAFLKASHRGETGRSPTELSYGANGPAKGSEQLSMDKIDHSQRN